jgi:sugar phosphate isomerase/epimerase
MHPSAADDFSFVDTLAAAANLVGDVDQASLGILFDTWHVGQGRDAVDELRALVDLVVGVHVADALPPPRGWADRQFPGEGTLPIAQFLSVLESNGFKGSYDVEIFSDDGTFGSRFPDSLWELPDEVCLARATELLRGLLANTCPTAPSPTDAHIRETTFNQERRHV